MNCAYCLKPIETNQQTIFNGSVYHKECLRMVTLCPVCKKDIYSTPKKKMFKVEDHWVHEHCLRKINRCWLCGTYALSSIKIDDYRMACSKHFENIIMDYPDDLLHECKQTLKAIGFYPDHKIHFKLTDVYEFCKLNKIHPSQFQYFKDKIIFNFGRIHSTFNPNESIDRYDHHIYIVNGLNRENFIWTIGHEVCHAVQFEVHHGNIQMLSQEIVEGTAEYIGFYLARQFGVSKDHLLNALNRTDFYGKSFKKVYAMMSKQNHNIAYLKKLISLPIL